ncbi:DeoR/GlpR family transcriptional regulator of sugar metabolism [Paraburkholderia sp. RAU6.4a]|uniref:hypothetical protein n=1 Tax=Paraburkholderia sp. RAU6.4a TaxID=2991067 RepID=UPI003D1B77BB
MLTLFFDPARQFRRFRMSRSMFFLISPCSWYLRRGVIAPSAPKVDVKRAAMAAASGNLLVSDADAETSIFAPPALMLSLPA